MVELALLPVAHPGSILGMTTFVVILFGSNLIKHVGWRAGALATPTSMALLAAPLFTVVIASKVRERVSCPCSFSNEGTGGTNVHDRRVGGGGDSIPGIARKECRYDWMCSTGVLESLNIEQ